jgi:hypothetical protein
VTFSADIDRVSNSKTRTTNGGNEWQMDDAVGIYMVASGGTIPNNVVNGASNVRYNVINATTGALAPDMDSKPIEYPEFRNGSVDFIACYPYANYVYNGEYIIDLRDQTNPALIDVMIAKSENNPNLSVTPVKLNFKHVLSKITINIKAGVGVEATDIESATLLLIPCQIKIDLNNGEVGLQGSDDIKMLKTEPTTEGYHVAFTAIVSPDSGIDRSVVVKVGDRNLIWSIPDKDVFKSGKHNIYRGEITRSSFSVGETEIVEWINDDHEELLDKPAPKLHEIITWDADNGRYAFIKEPADAGLYFKFGSVVGVFSGHNANQALPDTNNDSFDPDDVAWDPTGAITVDNKAGWNSVPMYDGTTDFTLNPNTVTSPLYHNAANVKAGKGDPCRLVGLDLAKIKNAADATALTQADIDNGQWRLPTADENMSFAGLESNASVHDAHWTWIASIRGDIKGGMFPDKTTGSPASFLPVAGNRAETGYGSGQIMYQGITGEYSSSTPCTTAGRGYVMRFDSGALKPMNEVPYSRGCSVRCVRQ